MKWISVKDALPEMVEIYKGGPKKARVIGYHGWVGECSYEETFVRRTAGWKNKYDRVTVVTHWMPLPEPPK